MTEEHPTADDYRNRAERAERQCEELMAEIERLREALGDLLTRFDAWSPHDHIAAKKARAALGETDQ